MAFHKFKKFKSTATRFLLLMMAETSIPHRWSYDVFVSFRGEDIRKSFMDHLFKDFRKKAIRAFRDDKELRKGEEISPELYKAIEQSRFLLVIFSKNYASSSWCLRELVKILECKQIGEHKQEVRTIFYDVKPNVVRKQTESYAKAFVKHESSNRTEAAKWREALSMAADLSGWDLEDMTNRYESKFIDNISKEILERLYHGPLDVGENLVGVNARVDELSLLRFVGSNKVHIIGICGIGGIGKTTFAKAMYNKLHIYFEECSFCEDVQGTTKRHALAQIQMQLIDDITKTRAVSVSNVSQGVMVKKRIVASKRILLVLDGIDHSNQIDALAGSPCWFFPGSVIIFTCKDKQLLSSYEVDEIYDMGFLDGGEALELFSLHAFGKKYPTKDFKVLSDQVVQYVQGHPLALKVLGRFLSNKTKSEWKSELDRLRVYPNADVQKVLRLSFDGLAFDQEKIFLDIAYAFIGEKKDFTTSVLESCTQFPQTNIRVLVDKSLITISSSEKLQMHDLIQIMAREIIREESNMPGKRSRLWIQSKVLKEIEVTEAVEVLVILLEKSSQDVHIDGKAFARMKNLRILKIYDPKVVFPEDFKVNYTGRLGFLSNKLSLLCWHGCPVNFLPSDFCLENIVAIDLSCCHIKNLWTKPKCFRRLKVMKLRHYCNLTSTPNFTETTNLEELYLDGCLKLVKVHPSVGMLKRLVVLSMRDCKCVMSFHCKFEMESLKVLNLSGCSEVDKFPEFVVTIKNLVELRVDGTGITELPYFVSSLSNIQVLSFGQHEGIWSRRRTSISKPCCFPSKLKYPQSLVIPSLESLCFLRELNLSHCNILQVPDSIGGLSCLEHLYLKGNKFTSLPRSLSQLPLLEWLVLDGCNKLEVLPDTPPMVTYFSAENCISLQEVQKPLLKHDYSSLSYKLRGCSKLVRYMIPIESAVCISQLQDHDTSITSHGSRNGVSSFISSFLSDCISENIFPMQNHYNEVDMVLDGSRGIPEWFRNQSKGNDDVKVELPQSCKLRGYGTCVIVTPKKPYTREAPAYVLKNADGASLEYIKAYDLIHDSKINHDITWLRYTTDIWGLWKGATDFVTFSIEENEEYEVKEWGVRIVYEEEDMDLKRMEELPTLTIHGARLSMLVGYKYFIVNW